MGPEPLSPVLRDLQRIIAGRPKGHLRNGLFTREAVRSSPRDGMADVNPPAASNPKEGFFRMSCSGTAAQIHRWWLTIEQCEMRSLFREPAVQSAAIGRRADMDSRLLMAASVLLHAWTLLLGLGWFGIL